MYQLENLVQEQLPELHLHFQSQVGVKSEIISFCVVTNDFIVIPGLSNVYVRIKLVPNTLHHSTQPQPHLLPHHGRFPK